MVCRVGHKAARGEIAAAKVAAPAVALQVIDAAIQVRSNTYGMPVCVCVFSVSLYDMLHTISSAVINVS